MATPREGLVEKAMGMRARHILNHRSVRFFASTLCLLIWVVSACSGDSSTPDQNPLSPLSGRYSYTPAPSHTPGGNLIFALRGFPTAINPLFSSSPEELEVSAALWSAPVVYDEQFHVQPVQLTEVPLPANGDVRDDGKTIIMHLRHDLRWSDGQPILASDFQYWWQLDQDADTGAITTGGYDQIASIDATDRFTVVLHMKHAFGPYLLYLPYAAPQHAWGQFRPIDLQNMREVYQAPIVTDGAYKLARFVDQQSYTLAPNPYYTSTTFHGPFLSQLIYQAYDSLDALSAAIREGRVDVSGGYMEYELPALAHLPSSVKTLATPAAAYEHLDFNMDNALFQDRNVRQAVQMAIDKCGIVRSVLHAANCARVASQVEPQPSLVYDVSIQASVYDPPAARQLLARAGWQPDGHGGLTRQGRSFVVRLVTTTDNPLRAAAAAQITRDLLAVGIVVKVQYYDLGTFFGVYSKGGILATGAYDMAMFGYANSPEPDDEYGVFHSSQIPSEENPALGNYGRVRDPLIDQALTQARYSVDFAERVRYYHQFLERLAGQVYVIPLYVGLNIMTANVQVQNVLPNPNAVADNWNISDWWLSGSTKS